MYEYQPLTDLYANNPDMVLTEDMAQGIAGEYLGQLALAAARKFWGWVVPESVTQNEIQNEDTPAI